jgi:uncharacterized repeat protein (TIGR03803 family)
MSKLRQVSLHFVTLIAMTFLLVSTVWGQATEQVLRNFDLTGYAGQSHLLQDSAGRLYGTTYNGGNLNCGFSSGCGEVFVLHQQAGVWLYTRIYTFHTVAEGLEPRGNLVFDAAGNLYGTTAAGGTGCPGPVFKLTPGSGGWTLTNIHIFGGSGDGTGPWGGLTIDAAGNLYGTTRFGGAHQQGTVFKMTPNSDGTWSETVLHSFSTSGTEGAEPAATVTLDAAGNIYGSAEFGGSDNIGTIFELSPNSSGGWTETTLHTFTFADDFPYPSAPVLLDSSGNVYGTTSGGAFNGGEFFKLSPGGGTWTETVLHIFGGPFDGYGPDGPLVPDPTGNLYGTTLWGGLGGLSNGTVYQLHPNSDGTWSEHVIYSFAGGTDGREVESGVTFGRGGAMYGMTVEGGTQGMGMIFKITP